MDSLCCVKDRLRGCKRIEASFLSAARRDAFGQQTARCNHVLALAWHLQRRFARAQLTVDSFHYLSFDYSNNALFSPTRLSFSIGIDSTMGAGVTCPVDPDIRHPTARRVCLNLPMTRSCPCPWRERAGLNSSRALPLKRVHLRISSTGLQ